MRVLVTGGAGFIGSHIVDALLSHGHQPYVVDNLSSGRRENLPDSIPLFEVDICDRERLASAVDEAKPDAVCHQAAQMSVSVSVREPAEDARVNVMGLLNVFDNAVRVGAQRIVIASSGGVLYGDVSEPADETHEATPISPYGISKWVGEKYLEFYTAANGIKGVALRYANVYGPRQNPHGEAGVVAIFSQMMLAGDAPTIHGDGSNIRDYVYVGDVADANLKALESDITDDFVAFNVGTGQPTDVNMLAAIIQQNSQNYWEQSGNPGHVPQAIHGPTRDGDLQSSLVASGKIAELLHWAPQTTVADGLEQTVDWFSRRIDASN